MGGGAAPPNPPHPPRGGLRPPSTPFYGLCRFHSKAESHTSLQLRQQQMHRFRITERPSAQLQDSGAPEGYRRKELFKKKGAITMEGPPKKTREWGAATVDSGFIRKRNRTERPRANGGRSFFKKESVFRRPQRDQNQVRDGTPRFRGALGGVMLCFEEETERREESFKTRRRNGGGAAPRAPLRLIPVSFESGTRGAPEGYRRKELFKKK